MSRTWKDRPYRVMAKEAVSNGWYSIENTWAQWNPVTGNWVPANPIEYPYTRSNLVPEVEAWGYGSKTNVHVPSARLTMYRWIEEDWIPDWGTRRSVRDGLRDAVRTANTYGIESDELDEWDDPETMRRRIRWKLES